MHQSSRSVEGSIPAGGLHLQEATFDRWRFRGIVEYQGQAVNTWSPNSKLTSDYVNARRNGRNALDWVTAANRKWVASDLEIIEKKLAVERTTQMTPPQSQSD